MNNFNWDDFKNEQEKRNKWTTKDYFMIAKMVFWIALPFVILYFK